MADMQFVIFTLGSEKYAVNLRHVSSITKYTKVTKVPNAPAFMEGIINLRGDIVPIVSLKHCFGIASGVSDERTRIIISQVGGKELGFVVDEAFRVMSLRDDEIEPPPEMITGPFASYVQGIGKTNGEIIVVIDLERVLTQEEALAIPA